VKNMPIHTSLPPGAGLMNVIDPSETRAYLIRGLEMVGNKREQRLMRKHGNIPL
jgi:propionyl-CoA carboxylase beta chain